MQEQKLYRLMIWPNLLEVIHSFLIQKSSKRLFCLERKVSIKLKSTLYEAMEDGYRRRYHPLHRPIDVL